MAAISPSPVPSLGHSSNVLDKAATLGKKVVKEILKRKPNADGREMIHVRPLPYHCG